MTAAIFPVVWQGAVRNGRWYCQGWNGLCRGRVSRRSVLMKLLGWWKMVAWRVSVYDESMIFFQFVYRIMRGHAIILHELNGGTSTWIYFDWFWNVRDVFSMIHPRYTKVKKNWRNWREERWFWFPKSALRKSNLLIWGPNGWKSSGSNRWFPVAKPGKNKSWTRSMDRGNKKVNRWNVSFLVCSRRRLVSICLIGCFAWTNEPSKAEIDNSGWQKGWWIVDLIVWEVSGEERTIQGGTWICDFPSTIIIEIS